MTTLRYFRSDFYFKAIPFLKDGYFDRKTDHRFFGYYPDDNAVDVTQEDGGARHVFDPLGEGVDLGADVVDDPLDGGIEQLDDEDQNQRRDHERGRDGVDREPDRQRDEQDGKDEVFAEGRLVLG